VTLEALPDLRYIGVLATGYNIVDVCRGACARDRGEQRAAYGTPSVAQAVFALLLELTHRTGHHAERCGRPLVGVSGFSFWDFPLVYSRGETFGVVGYAASGGRSHASRPHWNEVIRHEE